MTKPDRYAVLGIRSAQLFSRNPPELRGRTGGKHLVRENRGAYRSVAEKAEELLDEGYKGCNITLPFKLDAISLPISLRSAREAAAP